MSPLYKTGPRSFLGKIKVSCNIFTGKIYFYCENLTLNSLTTLLGCITTKVVYRKTTTSTYSTGSNIVQLPWLLAVHYLPSTRFVSIASVFYCSTGKYKLDFF